MKKGGKTIEEDLLLAHAAEMRVILRMQAKAGADVL
jgi:hypothetical protein